MTTGPPFGWPALEFEAAPSTKARPGGSADSSRYAFHPSRGGRRPVTTLRHSGSSYPGGRAASIRPTACSAVRNAGTKWEMGEDAAFTLRFRSPVFAELTESSARPMNASAWEVLYGTLPLPGPEGVPPPFAGPDGASRARP